MVRSPCCEKMGLKKGPWTAEEDHILISFIQQHGHGNWRVLPKQSATTKPIDYWTLQQQPNTFQAGIGSPKSEAMLLETQLSRREGPKSNRKPMKNTTIEPPRTSSQLEQAEANRRMRSANTQASRNHKSCT
ncbi:hypothetical protein U1Q18_030265 [Sarracenia purpurea var. burkii]